MDWKSDPHFMFSSGVKYMKVDNERIHSIKQKFIPTEVRVDISDIRISDAI